MLLFFSWPDSDKVIAKKKVKNKISARNLTKIEVFFNSVQTRACEHTHKQTHTHARRDVDTSMYIQDVHKDHA